MDLIKTKEWGSFALVKENRDILTGKKYDRLKKAIEEAGYLIQPIVVMPYDGSKDIVDLEGEVMHGNSKPDFIVVDGQHRLTICKELGWDAHVVVNDNVERRDIIRANNTGNKWSTLDYVKYYKEKGNVNYIQLQGMIDAWQANGFTPNSIVEGFKKGWLGGASDVRDGIYEVDLQMGTRIMTSCEALKPFFNSGFKHAKVMRALKNIYTRFPSFKIDVLVELLTLEPRGIVLEDFQHIPANDANLILDFYAKHFPSLDTHAIPNDMREYVIAYYNGRCNFTGCSEEANHVDHKTPFSKGGATEIDNLQLLCEDCNKRKSNKMLNSEYA